ncbi:MAG: ketoacyl-ACP synthase III [Candidatus Dadabacteria bacterium]|nr:MAG: ketoacyl-ACP synthase III [Candidatus Dadabacteria bacterium]
MPARSRILGWGFEVPPMVVTNDDLAPIVDTSDEWVRKRTGIVERRYVVDGEGSTALAETASRRALEKAGMDVGDVDALICCTLSPDVDFPGNSSLLHERLGLPPVLAFDVRNQCSGFLYALALADHLVRAGRARNVLVVGSEVHSSGLDFAGSRGRDVTVLFGDGAGAVVVGPSEDENRGLLAFKLHAEGRYADKLCVVGPSHRRKPRIDLSLAPPESPYIYPVMEGRFVFKHAVTRMTEVIQEVLGEVGATADDISVLIPHQANLRINQLVAMGLGIGDDRMVNNIDRYGNTTAATIPILLAETLEAGRIRQGDLVCFVAFGAGFTWAAALARW